MSDPTILVRARVRHEPDRSYAVLVEGPDGEVEVGRTGRTADLWALAQAGAARLFGESLGADNLILHVPQPPYGRDGQWVRIIAVENPDDPSESADIGVLAQARWFGHEGAWFVTVTGTGTGIVPSEFLDFEPVVTDEQVAAFHTYLAATAAG
ncbi:hypothetical protein LADH09A_002798 [Micromonospora sp. LAH09]|uniref:hypothetical protein n=1 Tax=Micromonospora cabrerizensis TaxID=2911213 RepID=UPI001EE97089|nr:hypothetical protein [Micromonospora cabrerizensis]MCG5468898.1 hypothetical protein [Micromonospora cabrerizensis]